MSFLRATALIIHGCGLVLGAFFAATAVGSVFDNFANDIPGVALSRIAVAVALASLTAAYGLALAWRGFTPIAPFLFAFSYGALGLIIHGNTRAMAKNFAPSPMHDVIDLNVAAMVQIAVVVGVALLGWVWTMRQSRFPLL